MVCGEDFTRNSSAKRHKRIVHQGNCLIVRHIEYVAGRASGLYPEPRTPPRMSRKRKIIKFQQGNNDNNTQLQHPTPPFPISDIIADEVWCGNAPESIIYSQPKTKWNNYIINKIESETEKLDPVDKALTIVRKGVEFKNLLEELSATKPKQQQQINPSTEYYNFRGTPFYVPSNDRVDQNNYNNNISHFLTKAISKQQTELTNEELLEFLKLVKTATFAFFKVKTKGSWHYYFMTLRN